MRHIRSQSAMEYLMTYGWAILIIAVVLGALFSLGVFSSANLAPRAQPGNCKIIRMAGEANPEGICQGELPEFVGQFNGQSSQIQLPASTELTGAFTVSFWLNPQITNNGLFGGNLNGGTTTQAGIALGGNGANPTIYYKIYNGIADATLSVPANTLSVGSWQLLTVEWDGTSGSSAMKLYLNGALVTSAAGITPPLNWDSEVSRIGWPYVAYFQGSMANFQIYNTSLDANQVNALYMEGIGGAPIDPYHIVGWWPLNGDENDYSGNGNTGTPTNVIFNSQWTPGYTQP